MYYNNYAAINKYQDVNKYFVVPNVKPIFTTFFAHLVSFIISAAFSAVIIVGAFVFPDVI